MRDPVGEPNRLRWYVERALEWLYRAARDQLLARGDRFELPERPQSIKPSWRVVHDENSASYNAWNGSVGSFGIAQFATLSEFGAVLVAKSFKDKDGAAIRAWSGREASEFPRKRRVQGYWWLWPHPVVLTPWQTPETWGELRRIGESLNIDVDTMLRWLGPKLRDSKHRAVLLVGYPIPLRKGDPPQEVHWDSILLPELDGASVQPRGYRANAIGLHHRERFQVFADRVKLEYLPTNNWSGDRLQARGRMRPAVRDSNIVVVGIGALGSILSEMLVRAGVNRIMLIDDDVLERIS